MVTSLSDPPLCDAVLEILVAGELGIGVDTVLTLSKIKQQKIGHYLHIEPQWVGYASLHSAYINRLV